MKSNFNLKGKVAIVTGANGLIGKEHCKALSSHGADVIACDLNLPDISFLRKGNNMSISFDITNKNELIKANNEIIDKYKKIDILVNNAAINDKFENPELAADLSKFENYPLENWNKSLNVNITGTFLCCQVFGKEMKKNDSASIINIASTYGIVGPDQNIYKDENGKQKFHKGPSYPTTKGAIINFTRYLAAYWGKNNIRVNCISPGGVYDNQDDEFVKNYASKTPLGRMAKSNDYHGALVFLASDSSSYMTGANLVVDGGWTAI